MSIRVWDDRLINFTPDEMMCKKSGGFKFHPEFALKLQLTRTACAFPFIVTSCCRSKEYNASLKNSSPKSLHVFDEPNRGAQGTCAIDLKITDSVRRAELLKIGLMYGFSFYYIGGNPNFIHLDLRTDLGERQVAW